MSKDFSKILTASQKTIDYLKTLTNPWAKRFFITYYSGQTKKGYDPAPMFTYFITFINNISGVQIPETNENQKEFISLID